MAKKQLKILLLFDISIPPPLNQDFTEIFKSDEWKDESILIKTLKNLGHEVIPFGIYDNILPLISFIQEQKPDLVFNQCEAFYGNRDYEPNIVSMLELLRVPYTGASPHSLLICKDKGLTKKILSYHRIRIPKFLISRKNRPLKKLQEMIFPAFIKPLALEASEGIAQLSFTENESDALERVKYIHDKFKCDAIVEEYIDGREIYVGVFGNDRIKVLPPRELFFKEMPDDSPKFATFKAKWDDQYRKKWGIKSGVAKALDSKTEKHLNEVSKKIYQLFQIKGFARIDFRLSNKNELVFIEANPNPSIFKDEDFALAAEKAGIDYETLLSTILSLSI